MGEGAGVRIDKKERQVRARLITLNNSTRGRHVMLLTLLLIAFLMRKTFKSKSVYGGPPPYAARFSAHAALF
jgi:hypothetical protein